MDRINAGRRYVLGATRLIDRRARESLGFSGMDSIAFTEVNCGAPEYKDAEQTGMIRDLGAPAGQPSPDFAFKFDFKPCMTNTLDAYRNIYTRELGLGEPPISIPVALTTVQMAAMHAARQYRVLRLSDQVFGRQTSGKVANSWR